MRAFHVCIDFVWYSRVRDAIERYAGLDEHRGRAFCGTRPHNVNFQLGTQTVPCVRHYHLSLLHTTAAVLRPAHRRRVRRISQH